MAASDGLGVLVVRHDRKGGGDVGESARGSSAFAGAVDIVLQLQRAEGNARPTVRVVNALSRFEETPDQLAIELTDAGYVVLGNRAAVALVEARHAVAAAIPTSEGAALSEKELIDAADVRRTIGQESLGGLAEAGVIVRVGAGKRGDPFRYWCPDKGKLSAAIKETVVAERNADPPPTPPSPLLGPADDVIVTAEKLSAGTPALNAAESNGGHWAENGEKLSAGAPVVATESNGPTCRAAGWKGAHRLECGALEGEPP